MEWIIIGVLIILDQITKYMVQISQPLSIEVIPNFFYITYVKNDGAAWNMLAGKQTFLSLLAAVAIGVMLYFLLKQKQSHSAKLNQIALACMIAGAAGNLIDRLVLNYVRDFLHFYPFGYDFPVLNIADTALTIGVILLILESIIEEVNLHKKSGVSNEQN